MMCNINIPTFSEIEKRNIDFENEMKNAILKVKEESIKGKEVFEDIEESSFLIESISWGSNTHLFNKIGSFVEVKSFFDRIDFEQYFMFKVEYFQYIYPSKGEREKIKMFKTFN